MPVYANSGPGLGEALLGGADAFINGRRRKKQDERADQLFEQQIAAAKYQQATQHAQNEANGLHILGEGELLPRDVSQNMVDFAGSRANAATPRNAANTPIDFTGFVDPSPQLQIPKGTTPPIISRAGAGAPNTPGAPASFRDRLAAMVGQQDRGAQYQVGKGFYIDKAPQWQQQDAAASKMQAEKAFEIQIADQMARAGEARRAGTAADAASSANAFRSAESERERVFRASQSGDAQRFQAEQGRLSRESSERAAAVRASAASQAALTPKPTEFSNKAALVYPRAQQSAAILNEFFDKGAPAESMLSHVPLVGNYMQSGTAQRMNQAAETVAGAILRLESGAAISQDEIRRYARQFLPEPGDSEAVRQQKKATLAVQLDRLRAASQPSMGGSATPSASPVRDPGGNIDLRGDTAVNPWRRP